MGIVNKVMEKVGWKPPTSKESGITDSDTLFSDKIISYVEMFYNDDIRIVNANIDRSQTDYRYSQESNKTRPVKINLNKRKLLFIYLETKILRCGIMVQVILV
jgi:hypothetical protein